MSNGVSTADCLLASHPIVCDNILDYSLYVVSVATDNEEAHSARDEVTIIEPWQPIDGTLAPLDGVVQLNVGVDLVDPFTPDVLEVVSQLEAEFGQQLQVTFRQTPMDSHLLAMDAARAALSGISIERVVAAYGGGSETTIADLMRDEGFEAQHLSVEVEQELAASIELMSTLGVSSSPTFWVDGYRCSGAQRAQVLGSMIRRVQAIRGAQ
jgi:hypothetical protein